MISVHYDNTDLKSQKTDFKPVDESMSIIGLIENNDDNKNMVRLAQEKLPGYKPE